MNTLKTDILGGFPWVLDDFRWHHDAVQSFFTALIKGLGVGGDVEFIIEGVEVTGDGAVLDVSAGYVYVNGEVVQVDAHTVPNPELGADYTYIAIVETFDPAGNKALEDGGTADAYKKRRAVLYSGFGTIGAGEYPWSFTSQDILQDIIATSQSDWATPWVSTIYTSVTGLLGSIDTLDAGYLRHKHVGRVCHIAVDFDMTMVGGSGYVQFDLHPNLTDKVDGDQYFVGVVYEGAFPHFCYGFVSQAGSYIQLGHTAAFAAGTGKIQASLAIRVLPA